jgi:flagellar basal-body rod protein FlgB
MDFSTINALKQALNTGSAQITAIANNMANVNTPGYKRKDVSFESTLDDAQNNNLQVVTLKKTDPRHMDTDDSPPPSVNYVTDTSGSMRADGNNVDIDAESSRLAAASIYYQGAAQLMQNQFSGLKYVITGGQ